MEEKLNVEITVESVPADRTMQLTALLLLMDNSVIYRIPFRKVQDIAHYEQDWKTVYPFMMHLWLSLKGAGIYDAAGVQRWFVDRLRKIMGLEQGCSVESVISAARLYVKAIRKFYLRIGRGDEHDMCPLSDWDWQHAANVAVVSFLRDWMMTQEQMRQNSYSFARNPFNDPLPVEDLQNIPKNDLENYFRARGRALLDAYKDLEVMMRMRQLQAEEEGSRLPILAENGPKGYRLPYTTLLAMEFIAKSTFKYKRIEDSEEQQKRGPEKNCFRIFKSIIETKKPLPNESQNGSNSWLSAACADYAAVLGEIARWEKTAVMGDTIMAKRYVIGSLMAIELEEAFRLHFACAFAKSEHRKGKKKEQIAIEDEITQALLGSNMFSSAHNIMTYEQDIRQICLTQEEEFRPYVEKAALLQSAQCTLFVLLQLLCPQKQRLPWEQADYQRAAKFFSKEYNVVKKLCGISFPAAEEDSEAPKEGSRRKQDHYDRMRKFYKMIMSWKNWKGAYTNPYGIYRQVKDGKK